MLESRCDCVCLCLCMDTIKTCLKLSSTKSLKTRCYSYWGFFLLKQRGLSIFSMFWQRTVFYFIIIVTIIDLAPIVWRTQTTDHNDLQEPGDGWHQPALYLAFLCHCNSKAKASKPRGEAEDKHGAGQRSLREGRNILSEKNRLAEPGRKSRHWGPAAPTSPASAWIGSSLCLALLEQAPTCSSSASPWKSNLWVLIEVCAFWGCAAIHSHVLPKCSHLQVLVHIGNWLVLEALGWENSIPSRNHTM